MSTEEENFSNRSRLMNRTPPPTPRTSAAQKVDDQPPIPDTLDLEVVSTADIHNWMSTIESFLNDVCTIVSESKMNTEQKQKMNTFCRKIGKGTSEMAVHYESLK